MSADIGRAVELTDRYLPTFGLDREAVFQWWLQYAPEGQNRMDLSMDDASYVDADRAFYDVVVDVEGDE